MTHPKETLNTALKDAMKHKDTERRNALRLILSAIKQVEVDEQRELSEAEAVDILQKEAKKRRESITELEKANRLEQAAQEKYELALLEEFLPRQLTREEVEALAREAIAETNAATPKDMGRVMGVLTPKTRGVADGKMVSTIVRELLSQ